jgi:hypothetical protein
MCSIAFLCVVIYFYVFVLNPLAGSIQVMKSSRGEGVEYDSNAFSGKVIEHLQLSPFQMSVSRRRGKQILLLLEK